MANIVFGEANTMIFTDSISGRTIASGEVPAGWEDYSTIVHTAQSFGRPFSALVELRRANSGKLLFFNTGECFHKIKFGQGERHRDGAFDARTLTPVMNFQTPETYLDKMALRYSGGTSVGLFAREPLPGFSEEAGIYEELERSRERLGELCAPGIRIVIQNVYASAELRTYRAEREGKPYTLVLGAEICATEYCLREAPELQLSGEVVTPVDGMKLGIGMTAATVRQKAGGAFGGARTAGAKAAYVDWEARRVFGFLTQGEPGSESSSVLREWIRTFAVEDDLYETMRTAPKDFDAERAAGQAESFRAQAERVFANRLKLLFTEPGPTDGGASTY